MVKRIFFFFPKEIFFKIKNKILIKAYIYAALAYSEMQQYNEALNILSEKFSFASDNEIIQMKKTLNTKLEEQNLLIESKYN